MKVGDTFVLEGHNCTVINKPVGQYPRMTYLDVIWFTDEFTGEIQCADLGWLEERIQFEKEK